MLKPANICSQYDLSALSQLIAPLHRKLNKESPLYEVTSPAESDVRLVEPVQLDVDEQFAQEMKSEPSAIQEH